MKHRSKVDYAAILAGNQGGFNLGLDNFLFLRKEAVERVFNPPRIGTQGKSTGGIGALTDISALADDSFNIAVDGGPVTAVSLDVAGKTDGDLVAAEIESAVNAALLAASLDTRVWVEYESADDHYIIYSQSTGLNSSVVITDAALDNIADDLNLGVGQGGTEEVGTNDQDFLIHTAGGAKFEQPVESNPHKNGRFHVGVIKSKKVVDFDLDTLINMSGNAGDSLDIPIRLLLESAFGKETVVPSTAIKYEQDLASFTFSMVKVSTIFAEYFTGMYVKDLTLTVPGDAPGTQKFVGMGSDGSIAGIGKISAIVSSSAVIPLATTPYPHAELFTADSRVMIVSADGRTITAGADGSLWISSVDLLTDSVTLSAAVDAEADGYLCPWHPGAVQQTARDAIYTDLEGTFKFKTSGNEVCATNISLGIVNDHIDRNNCFGKDTNQGNVKGNRCTMTLTATLDLSSQNLGDLIQARKFGGFVPELVIGDASSGRYLRISSPKWIVSVPSIDLPENGTTPIEFTGIFYQSEPGARDPIVWEYL